MSSIRGKGCRISFDPAQEIHKIWNKEKFSNALKMCDILFCNRYEASSVLRYTSADSLSEVNAKMLICTKGQDGSELYVNGEMTKIPAVAAANCIDATGAGDAYRAGFYAGKYNKYSDTDAAVIGAATASFIVERTGALSNIPTMDMVMERARQYLRK
jgi:sugar/nucleoside kinase (ribokinase family)